MIPFINVTFHGPPTMVQLALSFHLCIRQSTLSIQYPFRSCLIKKSLLSSRIRRSQQIKGGRRGACLRACAIPGS